VIKLVEQMHMPVARQRMSQSMEVVRRHQLAMQRLKHAQGVRQRI
jgi:hypothetical protein